VGKDKGVSPQRRSIKNTKPRSGDSKSSRELLSPLRGLRNAFWTLFRGLTPTAICYRRFAAQEKASFQKAQATEICAKLFVPRWRFGLMWD
jgi:hypothetical protein